MAEPKLCPICKRPVPKGADAAAVEPFCSKRCADIDLLRWLNGAYAIPAVEDESEPGDETDGEAGGEGQEGRRDLRPPLPRLRH